MAKPLLSLVAAHDKALDLAKEVFDWITPAVHAFGD